MIIKAPKKEKIAKVEISITQQCEVLEYIENSLKKNHKFFIVTPNPEIVALAQKDDYLLKVINSSDLSVIDGIGLLIAAKLYGFSDAKLIKGRELMIEILKIAHKKCLRVFLLGSTEDVILRSIVKINEKYKDIEASGAGGPVLNKNAEPINQREKSLEESVINKINRFKPDILFIAFGAPKQEIWYYKNKNKLITGGAMVVGGSFDYFSGKQKLPPLFLAVTGFEWFWRLLTKKGHAKRVFTSIFIFPYLVLKSNFDRK